MKKSFIILGVATMILLAGQPAMAGTRVSINLGFPVIGMGFYGHHGYGHVTYGMYPYYYPERVYIVHEYMPRPYRIWVPGHSIWDHNRRVWVPGHWETVYPEDEAEYRDGHHDRDYDQYYDDNRGEDREDRY
jgi:hypothetical protein